MTMMKHRLLIILALTVLAIPVAADSIRGLVTDTLLVSPAGGGSSGELGLDEILLGVAEGDPRFFDALEVEVTVPASAVEIPGALSLQMVTTGNRTERAGITEINGTSVLAHPLTREGRLTFLVPLHPDAEITASAAVTIIDHTIGHDNLPIALVVLSHMKGSSPSITESRFPVHIRSVSRNIGAARMVFPFDDGTQFQTESYLAPDFELRIDGIPVSVDSEYLLEPGLHRFTLISERYLDQEITAGIEQAVHTEIVIPLLPALATVNYSAPRGSRVYVDGEALSDASGDFTAMPGQHTIVVVVGDYTVTRRFAVEEGLEYSLSITMDVVIEEAK